MPVDAIKIPQKKARKCSEITLKVRHKEITRMLRGGRRRKRRRRTEEWKRRRWRTNDIRLWGPPWPPDCSKMRAMPDPGTKRKRERKINIVQLNTKQGSVELRGICYLLNSLLYLLLPKAHNSLQSLMHELALSSPVLSSGNRTFAVRTGLKRLREKTREVRSVLTYWSKPPSALQQTTSCFDLVEGASRPGIFLRHGGHTAGHKVQFWFVFCHTHMQKQTPESTMFLCPYFSGD